MQKLAAAVAAVATLVGTSAFAADMAVKAPLPVPVYSWTGWYVGLNAGGGWENTIDNSAAVSSCAGAPAALCPGLAAAVPGQFNTHPSGFIGGAQIGYNYQTGAVVWGVETDFQGAGIKGSASATNTVTTIGVPITVSGTGSQKLDWFGTLRGRLGWEPTSRLLIYATGGLAYGNVEAGASFSQLSFPGGPTAAFQSSTLAGWTVGSGLEWMFAPRWSVKGEYLYYDLGNVTLNQTLNAFPAGVNAAIAIQSVAHYHGNIARLGVNYKFY